MLRYREQIRHSRIKYQGSRGNIGNDLSFQPILRGVKGFFVIPFLVMPFVTATEENPLTKYCSLKLGSEIKWYTAANL